MTENEIRDIANNGVYENTPLRGKIEETHISWVILSKRLVFKIKKPVRLSFLDFSTCALRKQQCERELALNRRFSDIYLSVQPIRMVNGQWTIGGIEVGEVVDYCVVMRKMAASKRMDKVLQKGYFTHDSIRLLASKIAFFHANAEKVFAPFDIRKSRETFNEIGSVVECVSQNLGVQFSDIVNKSIEWSNGFLERHASRMEQRVSQGFKRDVHGDLHARNVFLYRNPVLFDCIEFNDEFRQIDVLYEIAFLCMDFDGFGQGHLSKIFLSEYTTHLSAFQETEDYSLFEYFKCLRANIRAKVHGIQLRQAENEREVAAQISETRKYLSLMNQYISAF